MDVYKISPQNFDVLFELEGVDARFILWESNVMNADQELSVKKLKDDRYECGLTNEVSTHR